MTERARLTDKQKVDIINAYETDLVPMITLAKQYGISRQGIHKLLKKYVDTSKHPMTVSCSACGAAIQRTKGRIRKQLHHFCHLDCYTAYLQAGNGKPYIQSRNGQKIARTVVAVYFALQAGHVVHHEDRNTLNNDLKNLKVFANQGDHVRHHRGFDVEPIWDGRATCHRLFLAPA